MLIPWVSIVVYKNQFNCVLQDKDNGKLIVGYAVERGDCLHFWDLREKISGKKYLAG